MKGVYRITCTASGNYYIGSSSDVDFRFYKHRWMLARGEHANSLFQECWNKHGEGSFEFEVLEEVPDDVDQRDVEQVYLDDCFALDDGLILNLGTDARRAMLGRKMSDEKRRELSSIVASEWSGNEQRRDEMSKRMSKGVTATHDDGFILQFRSGKAAAEHFEVGQQAMRGWLRRDFPQPKFSKRKSKYPHLKCWTFDYS